MVHATEDDVLYEEPRSVLAEEMARGREPSVVSHDTSGRDREGNRDDYEKAEGLMMKGY